MANLTSPTLIWLKGVLFAVLGLLASAILLAEFSNMRSAFVFAIAIWAFCRAYYFAFYVIEHYVDSTYRFSGLYDFAKYAIFGQVPDQRIRGK